MFFILIAVLGIVTTMTRITSNQRGQIGTMKALELYLIDIDMVEALKGVELGYMLQTEHT